MKRYLQTYKDNSGEERQLVSVEQAAKLAGSALAARDQAIILLFLKTGMRRGEMVRLDLSDINMTEMSLTLKETAKRSNRLLFFDSETSEALSRWLAIRGRKLGHEGPALFLSSEGTRLSKNQLQRIVTKHAQMVSLHDPNSSKLEDKFGPHCCRHWFTTHLRRAGMPREFIQELRGDVRREAIDIYDHIDKEELRRSYLACIPQLGIY
jgi:integrase/recombinase XerD